MMNPISIATVLLMAALPALAGPPVSPKPIQFATKKIVLAGKTLTVEIADDDEHREYGLMFRKHLAHDHGMLFIFQEERPLGFWMKNTLIPLSIGYFDGSRRLIDILEMEPEVLGAKELPTYPSSRPAMYALEMEKNWFTKNHVKTGARFEFAKSQGRTFDGRSRQ